MSRFQDPAGAAPLVRDLVRDYCTVYLTLLEQSNRLSRDRSLSYNVLHALMGEAMRKGVFWRLKDTAHHLFRRTLGPGDRIGEADNGEIEGAFVDWCVGFSFHECAKLREDAFQIQHYACRLLQLRRSGGLAWEMSSTLASMTDQTAESCRREMNRILHVLRSGMPFMIRYLAQEPDNCCLARWLATDAERVKKAFGHLYPGLVRALYGDRPEHMFTMAASDLLDCGRIQEARNILKEARDDGRIDADGIALLFALERSPADGSVCPFTGRSGTSGSAGGKVPERRNAT